MTTDTQKAIDLSLLSDQLAKLFGFADGVSDIVEHLFTIDSKDDLSDYLEQLLGSSARKQSTFDIFVNNVIRYQQGQPLIVEEPKANPEPALSQITQTKSTDKKKQQSKPSNPKTYAKSAPNVRAVENRLQKLSVKEKPALSKAPAVHNEIPPSTPSSSQIPDETSKPVHKPVFRKLSSLPKPPQGDAKVKPCDCFGTRHDVTVNCLYCGRISCSAEIGIVFCPCCRYQLHEKDDPVRIECVPPEALELKNKLLSRDRERTSQTKVYTDYMDHKSTWNSRQEAIAAQELEQQRDAQVHRRPGMQLQLGI
ncbi:hypothetical protein FisN_7Hu165 [Fistulifera solaris]|uniref:Uncharacterized protein n=1 Tax=Fistulifera solaris TaxID=1519565 RepID=A0A1Z5K3N2_FISSO|nr:hypothetical protein FisN_7Hu165 [Fistulifera solaris]|eukprot:GAX20850.1 hypothetical protein FisN_7Hu165 [Fistulifera solaris]